MNKNNVSHVIDIEERSVDERGSITSIMDGSFSNISIIKCNPDSIRSNHLHHNDTHHMYVLDGQIDYFYKDERGELQYFKVLPGQTVYTPSNEMHATYFPVETTLIVASKNPRDQESYESDTVREEIITLKSVKDFFAAEK